MKDKLRLLILVIPIALLSMVSAGYASVNDTETPTEDVGPEPYPYISPTPGEFPIIGWGLYFDTARSVFKDFVDCGFNAALIIPQRNTIEGLMRSLNTIKDGDTIKLNLILRLQGLHDAFNPEQTPYAMNNYLHMVQQYMNPNSRIKITSWFQGDEPSYYQFDRWSLYFHCGVNHDTSRMNWINLYGDPKSTSNYPYQQDIAYNSDLERSLVQSVDYKPLKQYVDEFCKRFRSGVLSYDYYPFVVNTDNVDITEQEGRLDDFYTALQVYSEVSKKRNRPFWAFCQCRAVGLDENYQRIVDGHPAPSEIFLRYEAFNALAFGAQGIEYWNYKEEFPSSNKKDKTINTALVTYEGEKTLLWDYARNVNREIKAFTNVFLGAKLNSYYFVGESRNTSFCDYKKPINTDPIIVTSHNPSKDTIGSNHGALVSTLVNGLDQYVVIVNQSPYEEASLNLALNNRDYVIKELKYNTNLSSANVPSGYIEVDNVLKDPKIYYLKESLKPAGYKIYRFKRRHAFGVKNNAEVLHDSVVTSSIVSF